MDFVIINLSIGAIIGISSSILTLLVITRFFRIERKDPYSWTCAVPECKFFVSTNSDDPELLMKMINTHKKAFHGQ